MPNELNGLRILVTHANAFMGPTLCEVLTQHGATALASTDSLRAPEAAAREVSVGGHMDVLVMGSASALRGMKREVPFGRLVSAREDAELAAYLCSRRADCFVGQVFPVAGGWAVR